MKHEDLFQQREGESTDIPFITKTWLQGLYGGNPFYNLIPWEIYARNYSQAIDTLLKRAETRVTVTCLKDDPDCIIGYAIWDDRENGKVLHWVHVKGAWRNAGVAKRTIPNNVRTITHTTKAGLGMRYSMQKWEWVFNPFSI